jgi:hypothetical protein
VNDSLDLMRKDDDARSSHLANRIRFVLQIVAFVVFIVGTPVWLWSVVRRTPSPFGFQEPTHSELISTLFTGAALILGMLAIIVAALAIWGYVAIKKEAAQIATASAKREIERYMKRDATHKEVRKIIEELAAPVLAELQAAAQMPSAYQDGQADETDGKTVGKSYPKNKEA